ncbi:MAG: hypothetical protein ACK4ND_11075 [Cytophagaceae bacterium]
MVSQYNYTMKIFTSALLVFSLLFSSTTYAGRKDSATNTKEPAPKFKSLKASYAGKTAAGHSYKMYAVQCKNQWAFLISDSLGYYTMLQDHKKNDPMETSDFFSTGVAKILENGLYKKVEKKKKKKKMDLEMTCYYKLNSKGRKIYKAIVYLENQSKLSALPAGVDLNEYERKLDAAEAKERRAMNRLNRAKRLEKKLKKTMNKF